MSARLPGHRALVTGGARGIGGRIAATLAAEGADVVILDRLIDEGSSCASEIGGRYIEVDLADAESAELATGEAVAMLDGRGRADSLGRPRVGSARDHRQLDLPWIRAHVAGGMVTH